MGKSFTQRILDSAGIPDESLPRQPLVELCGDRRVLIENHLGVAKYGAEEIHVRVRFGTVRICGVQLRLCRMLATQLIIIGQIEVVQLLRG